MWTFGMRYCTKVSTSGRVKYLEIVREPVPICEIRGVSGSKTAEKYRTLKAIQLYLETVDFRAGAGRSLTI